MRLMIDGNAVPFTSIATAPTVSPPRPKAITTGISHLIISVGTVPNFLEVLFNIGGGDDLTKSDSWLIQLKNTLAFSLHFFGDYTWLELFPGFFDKYETANALFVIVRFFSITGHCHCRCNCYKESVR